MGLLNISKLYFDFAKNSFMANVSPGHSGLQASSNTMIPPTLTQVPIKSSATFVGLYKSKSR